ncbi:thioredoxin domain-containing protein 17 [Drosophila sulfurigaster albostrigata]|uniref:thioredoxin domain-containing protein 17 n=1 Tax=Drosophila sulfurigaster albostrigata TaxID=89887 RepID=UPI002D21AF6C|nr:thioredoxin domain-containing protein 17 [Drosophila sulfurigaster albostrigata]
MPEYVPIKGYDQLMDALKSQSKNNCLIYLYFFGEKDQNGRSWCPDCVAVEQNVDTAFRENAHPNSLIYTVDVGNREAWKDQTNNKFRLHPFNMKEIPSLQRWNGVERLDGDQLRKPSLLELFFDEAKLASATDNTIPCK